MEAEDEKALRIVSRMKALAKAKAHVESPCRKPIHEDQSLTDVLLDAKPYQKKRKTAHRSGLTDAVSDKEKPPDKAGGFIKALLLN